MLGYGKHWVRQYVTALVMVPNIFHILLLMDSITLLVITATYIELSKVSPNCFMKPFDNEVRLCNKKRKKDQRQQNGEEKQSNRAEYSPLTTTLEAFNLK